MVYTTTLHLSIWKIYKKILRGESTPEYPRKNSGVGGSGGVPGVVTGTPTFLAASMQFFCPPPHLLYEDQSLT